MTKLNWDRVRFENKVLKFDPPEETVNLSLSETSRVHQAKQRILSAIQELSKFVNFSIQINNENFSPRIFSIRNNDDIQNFEEFLLLLRIAPYNYEPLTFFFNSGLNPWGIDNDEFHLICMAVLLEPPLKQDRKKLFLDGILQNRSSEEFYESFPKIHSLREIGLNLSLKKKIDKRHPLFKYIEKVNVQNDLWRF